MPSTPILFGALSSGRLLLERLSVWCRSMVALFNAWWPVTGSAVLLVVAAGCARQLRQNFRS